MVQLVPVPSKAKALSKGRPKRHPHRLVKATWKLRESHESAESCDACDLKCSYWMWHTRFGARKRRKRGNIELPVLCFAGFELSLGSAYFKWWPDKFKTKNSTGTWHWLMKQSKSVLLPQHSVSSVSSVCGFLVMFSPLFIRLHPVIPKLKPRKSALTRHSLAAFWTFEISSSSQPENFGRKNEQNRNVMKQLDTHTIASFTSHMTLDVVLQNVLMGFHGLCKSTAEQNRHVREEKFRLGRWQSWSSTSSSDTSKRIRNLQSQVPFSVSCHFLSFLFMSNVCRLRERLGAAFNDLLNISHDLALDVGGREALDFDLQCSVFAFRKKTKGPTDFQRIRKCGKRLWSHGFILYSSNHPIHLSQWDVRRCFQNWFQACDGWGSGYTIRHWQHFAWLLPRIKREDAQSRAKIYQNLNQ